MGCDIHCILEMKGKDGMWRVIKGYPTWRMDAINRELSKLNSSEKDEREQAKSWINWLKSDLALEECWIFSDRNYELFALLADVRNDDYWDALFPQRGLPELSAISTRLELRDWGEDAHSLTYFSLKEIKEANLSKEVKKTGVVDDEVWNEYLQNTELKQPRSWCTWTNCPNHNERTWTVKYGDIAKRFFDKVVSKMEILARHSPSGEEGVRLVIFFDN